MSLPQEPAFPVEPPAPPRKNNTVLWVILILVVGGGCLALVLFAAVLFPVFSQAKLAATNTLCISNVKRLGIANVIYAAEFDDKFPLGPKWNEAIAKYEPDETTFHCPIALRESGPSSYGYGFNEDMAGEGVVPAPEKTILLFESQDLSPGFLGGEADLADPVRHKKGGHFGMADSSAKYIPYRDPAASNSLRGYLWKP